MLLSLNSRWKTTAKSLKMVEENFVGPIRKVVVHDGHKGPKEINVSKYFLDWLTTPIEEDGRELFKEHQVTLEYQTHILKSIIGESKPKLDYVDFKQSNYDNCIKDTISFIREIWIEYCKSKGNIEQIREKRLSYPIKTKEERSYRVTLPYTQYLIPFTD